MDSLNLRQRILLNQPHIESVSGNIANFTTDMKAPLKECKVYFEPVQEGEGDPNPDNIRPISGWTKMIVNASRKNLLPINIWDGFTYNASAGRVFEPILSNRSWTQEEDRIKCVTTASYEALSLMTPLLPAGTYHYSLYKLSAGKLRYTSYIMDKSYTVKTKGYDSNISNVSRTVVLDEDGYIAFRLDNSNQSSQTIEITFQVEVGDMETVYEPYQEQTIPINWQSETGIVYGGSLDVLKGVLTVEWVSKILDGSDDEVWTMSTIQRFYTSFPNCIYSRTSNQNIRSDRLKSVSTSSLGSASINVCYTNGTGSVGVRIDDTIDSIDALRTWLAENPVQIVQKVIPITYQLTPQQLLTFKGTNNIWSNSNGQTEVKFWTH